MDGFTRRAFLNAGMPAAAVGIARPAASTLRRSWQPAYVRLERDGELAVRAQKLYSIYRSCRLCPRACGVNRLKKETGVCGSGSRVKVAAAHAHFGEEAALVGRGGSGTIFFSGCNLLCEYCQNWTISHRGDGSFISDEALGRMMIGLQRGGCENINLVTPTHFLPNIVQGLRTAVGLGLRIPLVYNCGGYEPVEILRVLDGIVDIYLPDFKYMDGDISGRFSAGAKDYPEVAAAAIAEMYRQVGNVVLDENGVALRGLIIRHLVLPNNAAGTDRFVRFVAERLSSETWVNIMPQYRPEHRARMYPELSRRLTAQEFGQALAWARGAGLVNIDLH